MTIAEHRMTDYLEAGAHPASDTRARKFASACDTANKF
jgi:hypothetical protein